MKAIAKRLRRLEDRFGPASGPRRMVVQYGYLKRLPEDYTGPRHTVTVRRLPPGPGAYSGEDWFEWEERPGPEPASNTAGLSDDLVLQVCFVETTGLHGCYDNPPRRNS